MQPLYLLYIGQDIYVRYGTENIKILGSRSVTCHPAAVSFPRVPQLKLILDLATPEECKAELTWWWLHPKIVYPPKTVTYLGNVEAV